MMEKHGFIHFPFEFWHFDKDDAAMHITEVVRGEDLLASTARQILIYRTLGLPVPDFYHCELMCDERGERLAKRHDSLSLRALRSQGITPEILLARLVYRLEVILWFDHRS